MDDIDFTDDEICKELAGLGYRNIPPERFHQFKQELFNLIRQEKSQNNSSITSSEASLSHPSNAAHSHFSTGKENAAGDGSNGDIRHTGKSSQHHPVEVGQRNTADDRTYPRHSESDRLYRVRDSNRDEASVLELPQGFEEPRQTVMKRKVLRKVDGQVSISESFTESEADEVGDLQERLRNTSIRPTQQPQQHRPMSAPPDVRRSADRHHVDADHLEHRPHTACREPMFYNLPEDYHGPKALIRPMQCDPHVRNLKKTDPVARYQAYQHGWSTCRAPGEKAHKQLRWGVREKMLYHDQVIEKKQPRCYQPNTYVVPSDKKRKTLRWQVRMDLAQGVKPHSVFDE